MDNRKRLDSLCRALLIAAAPFDAKMPQDVRDAMKLEYWRLVGDLCALRKEMQALFLAIYGNVTDHARGGDGKRSRDVPQSVLRLLDVLARVESDGASRELKPLMEACLKETNDIYSSPELTSGK